MDAPAGLPDRYAWRRRASRPVQIGPVRVGGDTPIVVQSMCTTPTRDVVATVAQAVRLAEVGCEMVRVTAPGIADARALAEIRREFSAAGFRDVPLIADIHFMPKAAMEAVEHVEKVRVNPGNYADKKRFAVIEYGDAEYAAEIERVATRFAPLVKRAKELGRALRIGVNHGSLSDRIMNRYGDTPEGMVESAMEFVAIAESEGYRDLVISMKSSNPKVMVHAYRLLVARLAAHGEEYPLHLGVTEAGDGLDGRCKGAAGIGALLEDGIGDTIRVSLTEEPEAEIPVARELAERYRTPPFAPDGALAEPPAEELDPCSFRRRVAGIVRLGENAPIGGGTVPQVIAPGPDPDADLALGGGCPDFRIGIDDPPPADPGPALVRIDLPAAAADRRLREVIAPLPEHCLLAIGDPGPLGTTRAHRLLAAVDDALFRAAESATPGSGVRHPLCIAPAAENGLLAIAATAGGLLIDGIGDALLIERGEEPVRTAFALLQAVKARITRADYVACPSCGRTLFDMVEVTDHIRSATKHLDGVTIAIMGCIVNGPGEMADADFGFVGSGPGKVDLYRGRTCVRRNLPFAEGRDALIALIAEHGMWREPPEDGGAR